MNKIREVLNKLARLSGYASDDERQEAIDIAVRDILSYLIESNEAPKDKVNTTGNPRNDEYIAEYNQANEEWRTYLKKKLED